MQHIKFVHAFANVSKNTLKKKYLLKYKKKRFEFRLKINTCF